MEIQRRNITCGGSFHPWSKAWTGKPSLAGVPEVYLLYLDSGWVFIEESLSEWKDGRRCSERGTPEEGQRNGSRASWGPVFTRPPPGTSYWVEQYSPIREGTRVGRYSTAPQGKMRQRDTDRQGEKGILLRRENSRSELPSEQQRLRLHRTAQYLTPHSEPLSLWHVRLWKRTVEGTEDSATSKPPSGAQWRGINHTCGSAMRTHSLPFNSGLQFRKVSMTILLKRIHPNPPCYDVCAESPHTYKQRVEECLLEAGGGGQGMGRNRESSVQTLL
ncbi:uncharacterized protein LOC119044736 isoform X2 [Artibeus jamaicensis]|uniref:uncharacterized protein LOC119044736 isoform X2 n=1 Tax=Artibeus jamaicensis TaxID=9417 RepID=UPI00235B2B49|nr:uncharacterized protein LOC119044736 isoform X2 [Artibeus jamaicensis]